MILKSYADQEQLLWAGFMDFDSLKWILEMLDRADSGREMRDQQESFQKVLDQMGPGQALRKRLESAQELLAQADSGKAIRAQQKALADAATASKLPESLVDVDSLLNQYAERIQSPTNLAVKGFEVPSFTIEAELSNLTVAIEGVQVQFSESLSELCLLASIPTEQMPFPVSDSLADLPQLADIPQMERSYEPIRATAEQRAAASGRIELKGFQNLRPSWSTYPSGWMKLREPLRLCWV